MEFNMANYTDLVDNEIDAIDAAVFSGDMFINNKNRFEFREWMRRWERQLISYDDMNKKQQRIDNNG